MTTAATATDRVYAVPLGEFTATRDAIARELRLAGDRAAADELRRLRKPTVAAWALNQVRRHDRALVDQLLGAGERLRDAQQRLLSGGDRGSLREAAIEERGLVTELVNAGERELAAAGHPVNATVQNRLRETLHAAAGSDEARELLAAGRLVRDYQISDLGLPGGVVEAPRRDARKEQAVPRDARKEQAVRRRLEKARAQQQRRSDAAREAERLAVEARRALAKASAASQRADAAAERARLRAREAEGVLAELQDELRAHGPSSIRNATSST